jgi:RNA polymerase sigma-70 factor (ECF subfamily)
MNGEVAAIKIDQFRDYLLLLARARLGRGGSWKLEASDIVQETLREAHEKRGQFRGRSEAEMAGWLRRLLACTIADAASFVHADKRDARLERSLEDELCESSAVLGDLLASPQSTPSRAAVRHEDAVRLARALNRLPEAQRESLVLRHFQGLSIEQVARELDRTPAAVGGLLRRGLRELRVLLADGEDQSHDRRPD